MAAKHLQVLDRAVLADDSLELHRPLNAGGLGQRRIGRLDPMNQQAFHHDRNPLRRANGGSDGDDRPVGWAEDGVEDSVRIPNWSGCARDRKSTRLNSSHGSITYAVFCLYKNNICKVEILAYSP